MTSYRARPSRPDRAKAIAAVVAVHAAMGALLLIRPELAGAPPGASPTVLIDIEPPPPPPPAEPQAGRTREEEGAAGKKAEPTQVVAPPTRLPAPTPLPAAPIAGTSNASTAGAAESGSGPGAGGSGTGRGGGGGSGAQYVSGGLRDSDYPRAALRERIGGTVSVRFTVLTTGRIGNCRVAQSSGSDLLDRTTCHLLTQRLRFRPATDARGRATESELGSDFSWGIRLRN